MANSKNSEAKLIARVDAIVEVLKSNGFSLPNVLDPKPKAKPETPAEAEASE